MDDAIFQEFKGTGNMELVLSRELADRRIWPAIDISRSGTRREEKILGEETLNSVIQLRRALVSMNPTEAMTELVRKLEMFSTNAEFLERVRSVL
ncbi:MAG: transcription termination factor Rho, partial [Planctomycetaceae bacterium]|nr:transcription termination factor Rho [Planctomycetaceae bacterium]